MVLLTVAHSLCPFKLTGEMHVRSQEFEYRIRPDWQGIMLLIARGVTNRDSVPVWPPTASIYIYRPLDHSTLLVVIMELMCVFNMFYVMVSVLKWVSEIGQSMED